MADSWRNDKLKYLEANYERYKLKVRQNTLYCKLAILEYQNRIDEEKRITLKYENKALKERLQRSEKECADLKNDKNIYLLHKETVVDIGAESADHVKEKAVIDTSGCTSADVFEAEQENFQRPSVVKTRKRKQNIEPVKESLSGQGDKVLTKRSRKKVRKISNDEIPVENDDEVILKNIQKEVEAVGRKRKSVDGKFLTKSKNMKVVKKSKKTKSVCEKERCDMKEELQEWNENIVEKEVHGKYNMRKRRKKTDDDEVKAIGEENDGICKVKESIDDKPNCGKQCVKSKKNTTEYGNMIGQELVKDNEELTSQTQLIEVEESEACDHDQIKRISEDSETEMKLPEIQNNRSCENIHDDNNLRPEVKMKEDVDTLAEKSTERVLNNERRTLRQRGKKVIDKIDKKETMKRKRTILNKVIVAVADKDQVNDSNEEITTVKNLVSEGTEERSKKGGCKNNLSGAAPLSCSGNVPGKENGSQTGKRNVCASKQMIDCVTNEELTNQSSKIGRKRRTLYSVRGENTTIFDGTGSIFQQTLPINARRNSCGIPPNLSSFMKAFIAPKLKKK